MNDAEVAGRLEDLGDPWWSPGLLNEVYGLRLPDDRLMGHFRTWASRLRHPRAVEQGGDVDRVALEIYFQRTQTLPLKWAAARLGMTPSSFEAVLAHMESENLLIRNTANFSKQTIDEGSIRDLHMVFPALQNRTFGSHDDWCERLHRAIRDEFGIDLEPLWCTTSVILNQHQPEYAYEYDVLTGDPVGLGYAVWLDLGKHISLRPDVCATSTFVRHPDLIAPHLFAGQRPEVPDGLLAA